MGPDADLQRGLVIVTFRTLEFFRFIGLVLSALGNGSRLRRSRHIDYRTDVTACTVRGHGPFPYQVDGDHLGDSERLELRHEPDALTIVVP